MANAKAARAFVGRCVIFNLWDLWWHAHKTSFSSFWFRLQLL